MEDRHAHRQADKCMAIEIGHAIVFGVVVQDAYTIEVLAPLGNGRVVHAEQDRLLPQCLWHYGKCPQRQGLATNGCIRDEAVAKGTVIAVERCVRWAMRPSVSTGTAGTGSTPTEPTPDRVS